VTGRPARRSGRIGIRALGSRIGIGPTDRQKVCGGVLTSDQVASSRALKRQPLQKIFQSAELSRFSGPGSRAQQLHFGPPTFRRRSRLVREAFTCVPLKKMPHSCVPFKSWSSPACPHSNFCFPSRHSVHSCLSRCQSGRGNDYRALWRDPLVRGIKLPPCLLPAGATCHTHALPPFFLSSCLFRPESAAVPAAAAGVQHGQLAQ
jgi:hypothetical protein